DFPVPSSKALQACQHFRGYNCWTISRLRWILLHHFKLGALILMVRLSTFVAVIVGFTSALPSVRGGQPFRFPEGKYGKGELKYINDLPVVTLAGTPEEIGEQMRMLTRSASPH